MVPHGGEVLVRAKGILRQSSEVTWGQHEVVPHGGEVLVRVKGVLRQRSHRAHGGNMRWYPRGVRFSLGSRAL